MAKAIGIFLLQENCISYSKIEEFEKNLLNKFQNDVYLRLKDDLNLYNGFFKPDDEDYIR